VRVIVIFSGAPSLRIHTRATAMMCETTLPFETDSFVNATLVVEQVQKYFGRRRQPR
jgi:hypothetical protein